ncbi:penicillin-binding transpeptidase domain-containing protein, partial [Streptomyces sp. SID10244]|nr:penicillin-binding transpeptidase domain-containing protein [Streptomyces sp. SID10244]
TGKAEVSGDTADIGVTYHWGLPGGREWSYPARIAMIRTDAGWGVRWISTDIHPDLGANQRLSLRTMGAPRATVNESDGSEVMVNGTVVGINFDAQAAAASGSVADSVTQLVSVLKPFDPSLSAQKIAEESTAGGGSYPITRLSQRD